MTPLIKPEMAFPTFTAPQVTFSPEAWPAIDLSSVINERFEATGRLVSGLYVRQSSPLTEIRFRLAYSLLTEAEKNSFTAEDKTGLCDLAGGATFEYKHIDGIVRSVRFVDKRIEIETVGDHHYEILPFELLAI